MFNFFLFRLLAYYLLHLVPTLQYGTISEAVTDWEVMGMKFDQLQTISLTTYIIRNTNCHHKFVVNTDNGVKVKSLVYSKQTSPINHHLDIQVMSNSI